MADHLGPVWQRGDDGKFIKPVLSLGWHILPWVEAYITSPDGSPWILTQEQKRFVLWWYAVDQEGRFLYRDGVLQRLKGWG